MNENENKDIISAETEAKTDITEAVSAPADGYAEVGSGAAAPAADAAGTDSADDAGTEAPAEAEAQFPTEAPAEVTAEAAGAAAEQPRGGAGGEIKEPSAMPDITDSDMRKIIADPMFIGFAKGKNQDIQSLCRDFCAMLESGENALSRPGLDQSVLMRVTPRTDGTVTAGVILTERQRMLAREAGMSYREYYDLIVGIPEKTK